MSDAAMMVSSEYVSVRDGTEIAVYIFRPDVPNPVPAVWMHDRYHQVAAPPANPEFTQVVSRVIGAADPIDPDLWVTTPGVASLRSFPWAPRLIKEGIAVVVADSRGSGASGGVSFGPFAPAEIDDMYDLTEWIASQSWCTGKIGMAGRSYLGVSQYLAMSSAPPHLVAVFPQMALFDLYSFAWDGGIFRSDFADSWGDSVWRRDCLDPVIAVDTDPDGSLLAVNRCAHRQNTHVRALFERNAARSDVDPGTGEQPYLDRSPSERLEQINQSGVAVYNLGGWHDIWIRDSLTWSQRLRVPHRTVIGPWSHTGGIVGGARFNLIDEHARWFGYWLKGGEADGKPDAAVRYYAMGSAERGGWRTASEWPPPGLDSADLHLAAYGRLDASPTGSRDLIAEHQIDYSASTGRHSRWANGYGAPLDYGELPTNDAHCAVFISDPLSATMEVTGEITLRLLLAPVPEPVDLFACLQAIDSAGQVHYVTEGCRRVATNHCGDIVIEMHPICWVFEPGDRIKLTVSGADRDNCDTVRTDPAPVLRIRCGSVIGLPINPVRSELASTAQRSIWLAEQLGGHGTAYHLPAFIEFDDPIDEAVLVRAVNQIVSRHDVLRTTLRADDGPLLQVISPTARVDPVVITIEGKGEAARWLDDKRVRALIDTPFDLGHEWPIRVGIIRFPRGRYGLVLVVHHVAGDQQAAATFFAELAALYSAGTTGCEMALPPLPTDYAAVAARQRAYLATAEAEADLAYWRTHLSGAPANADLPMDRARGDHLAPEGRCLATALSEELSEASRRLAASSRVSLYVLLLTAYSITISTFCGTDDLVVAVPNMDRGRAAERDLIGCFVNMLPVRVRLDPRQTLAGTLQTVRMTMLEALRHRRIPFDSIVTACTAWRDPAIQPLAQTSFRITPPLPDALPFGATTARPHPVASSHVKYDLAATVEDAGASLRARFEFRTALFDTDTIQSVSETFARVLTRMTQAPESPVSLACEPPEAETTEVRNLDPAVVAELAHHGLQANMDGLVACILSADQARLPAGAWGRLYLGRRTGASPAASGQPASGPAEGVGSPVGGPAMHATSLRGRLIHGRLRLAPTRQLQGGTPPGSPPSAPLRQDRAPGDASPVMVTLTRIWAELLDHDDVAGSDDFFDLGGDSLFAIRLIGRIRKATGQKLSLKDIFTASTLSAQAEMLAQRMAEEA